MLLEFLVIFSFNYCIASCSVFPVTLLIMPPLHLDPSFLSILIFFLHYYSSLIPEKVAEIFLILPFDNNNGPLPYHCFL